MREKIAKAFYGFQSGLTLPIHAPFPIFLSGSLKKISKEHEVNTNKTIRKIETYLINPLTKNVVMKNKIVSNSEVIIQDNPPLAIFIILFSP